ncbi:NRPS-like protein biosynthetic cluster [Penicillium concentricum]|uniref:NRPS-like protein biosynthetic cluster n=1 Tax=Penicillium concentricum TaxID=293559 RepID=A0A9W9R936_9EURO|nr:NRPS-like protein biosynthetic cluster [Penicillium concentricum]KAJ5355967.1 NRPS-like protein biosynthetic cluster [Penicillium concentricum]
MAVAVVQPPVVATKPTTNDENHVSVQKTVTHLGQENLVSIWGWNRAVPTSMERCIDEMIGERTRTKPMAPAVCAWDGDLTYLELDQLAGQIANRLVSLGIGPEAIIPLCFEKSRWMTVAMLAVIKAGAGFVALDPAQPERRLVDVVKQVNATVLLSSLKHEALGARLVDTVVSVSLDCPNVEPITLTTPLRARPSSVLYVVFTSGSTGVPKGVVIEHRNVASAIYHQVDRLGITADSRFYDFASYSYDVSISNALAILITGGCICTPSEQDRLDNIAGSIRSLRANSTALTPSVARLLVPNTVPEVRSIMLVGEPVRADDISRWKGRAHVICRYGVSESPAASTIYDSSTSFDQRPSIGTAAGLVTWVVNPNDHNLLSPLGAVGELLLEGPSLSRGYLNDPEKTAATFIQNPEWLLCGAPGQPGRHGRLYTTGDLVRYANNGALTFVGRKDNQVKIRGQRVELGDIEHHIQECLGDDGAQVVVELVMLPGPIPKATLVAFVKQGGFQQANDVPGTV